MYPNKIMQTSTVRDCSWKYPLSQDFFEVGNFLKLTFLPIETRQNNFLKFKQVMKYANNINKYCRTISFMSAKFALYILQPRFPCLENNNQISCSPYAMVILYTHPSPEHSPQTLIKSQRNDFLSGI